MKPKWHEQTLVRLALGCWALMALIIVGLTLGKVIRLLLS